MNDQLHLCLRPVFTEKIAQHLALGQAVNVFGEEGHGLGRFVEDIGRCCPAEAKFIRLNMRSFADSYEGFLQALCDALDIREQQTLDMRSALNRFLTTHEDRIWLCLEHFDRLSDRRVGNKTVDTKGYDLDFLNYLNSLNGNQRVALLLTSQREIATRELYIGGKRVRGSRLNIGQRPPLEELTFAEIENQLHRAMPVSAATQAFFKKKPAFFTPLVTEIAAHPAPLFFLESIAHKIPTDPATTMDDFRALLRFWKKDYAEKHAKSTDLIISDLERTTGRWLDRTSRLLGVSKVLRNINTKVTLIIGTVGFMLFGLYQWGERFWYWLVAFFTK